MTATLLNARTYGAAGDGVTDDATAINAALTSISSAGGGTLLVPPGTYLIGAQISVPSYCTLAGAGRRSTTIKVKDGANITAIANSDPTTGNTGVTITDLTIDGNKANNAGTLYGIYLVRQSDFSVRDVEIHDVNGTGLATNGMQTFCGPGEVERVYAHHCDNTGVQISNATRRVTLHDIHADFDQGYGVTIDASETIASGIYVRRNAVGLYIRNVFGCAISDIIATANDGHGILVAGMVRSSGSNWVAQQNGKSPINTANDIHFGPNPEVAGYGESADDAITGIVAGPSSDIGANYFGDAAATERYAVYFGDETNTRIFVSGLHVVPGSLTGGVRLPSSIGTLTVTQA